MAGILDPAGLVWSIAAGLTQPIFDGGTRLAERRAALALFKAAAADYRQTVLQAFGQVADILQALTHDADLLAAQQHALDLASEAVRLQRANYANGVIEFSPYWIRSVSTSRRGLVMSGLERSATRTQSSSWQWVAVGEAHL